MADVFDSESCLRTNTENTQSKTHRTVGGHVFAISQKHHAKYHKAEVDAPLQNIHGAHTRVGKICFSGLRAPIFQLS